MELGGRPEDDLEGGVRGRGCGRGQTVSLGLSIILEAP